MNLLGAGDLADLSEDIASKRAIDAVWQETGDFVLRRGMWNFAIRAVEIGHDEDVQALFGYSNAFLKPDDWVNTVSLGSDPTFMTEFEAFKDEGGYWHADADPLYVRYVSSDPQYGWNVGRWTADFAQAVAAYLAFMSNLPISSDRGNRNDMFQLYEKRLAEAKIRDAVDEPVQRRKPGRLVTSRFSGSRWNRMQG